MEVLGGVASGMAVASLSIQLLDSIGKTKAFIRDVKGASKELLRLVDLLDRLSSLLEDVRNVMERQTSLQQQQLPTPLTTIFACLKSCEASLQTLSEVVEKYNNGRGSDATAIERLKGDIKFGYKTKDITNIEENVQRDIDNLHMALGLNDTNILINVLPLLLQNQQNMSLMLATSLTSHAACPKSSTEVYRGDQTATSTTSQPKFGLSRRQYRLPSALEIFGIYQRRTTSSISDHLNHCSRHTISTQDTICEAREIIVQWPILGYGFSWVSQRPYGGILPSLRIFPFIKNTYENWGLLCDGTIDEIQRGFGSGKIHPYARDEHGRSILHWAVLCQRSDVCRLLARYGVKMDLSFGYEDGPPESPLDLALILSERKRFHYIDLFRTLLFDFEQIDEFDNPYSHVGPMNLSVVEWLWINAATVFHGTDLELLRIRLLCSLMAWEEFDWLPEPDYPEDLTGLLTRLIDDLLLEKYMKGTFQLLPHVFECWAQIDSHYSLYKGRWFLDLLSRLGLNVQACIQAELDSLPGGILPDIFPSRRVLFQSNGAKGWELSWEWVFDPEGPGYMVVSEYEVIATGPDSYNWDLSWPLHMPCPTPSSDYHWEARFTRRMAAKSRKDRARTGQKVPRSKMPGTWQW